MIKQTFQQLVKVVEEEIKLLKFLEIKKIDLQGHFYDMKKALPHRFERMIFDENGHKPYSQDLEDIITLLKLSGKYIL